LVHVISVSWLGERSPTFSGSREKRFDGVAAPYEARGVRLGERGLSLLRGGDLRLLRGVGLLRILPAALAA
jgi:hypothetical protein